MKKITYRKNVAAILFNGKNILLVRKAGFDFWQFIQGGVEFNEEFEDALEREVVEETGIKKIEIIKKLNNHLKWNWNPELQKLKGFKGQEQTFFLVKINPKSKVKLQKEELEEYKWVHPSEIKEYYPKKITSEILKELALF